MSPYLLRGKTIAVIGLGQIGGSIVRRLSPFRPKLLLVGHDRRSSMSARARRYCEWREDLQAAVRDADIILLCIPVPAIIDSLGEIARVPIHRRPLVMDTGTSKAMIMRAARRHRTSYDFIGLHPLAGSEKQGWEGADPGLFLGKHTVLCAPEDSSSSLRLRQARELIRLLGATPLVMDPREHDRMMAEAIALPHLLAFAAKKCARSQQNPLRAGSWASLTRVAGSEPTMVAGFLWSDRNEVRRVLRRFRQTLDKLADAHDRSTMAGLVRALTIHERGR